MTEVYLAPEPIYTATEAALMLTINRLSERIFHLECAIRSNLPAAGSMLYNNGPDIPQVTDSEWRELQAQHGTERTRSHLERYQKHIGYELPAELPVRLDEANVYTRFRALTAYFTRSEVYRLFLRLALDQKRCQPTAVLHDRSGWEFYELNGLVSAYYTYRKPNIVREMVWSSDEAGSKNYSSDGSSTQELWMPLEEAWVPVPAREYIDAAKRLEAFRTLFQDYGYAFSEWLTDDDIVIEDWDRLRSTLQMFREEGDSVLKVGEYCSNRIVLLFDFENKRYRFSNYSFESKIRSETVSDHTWVSASVRQAYVGYLQSEDVLRRTEQWIERNKVAPELRD